MAKEQQVKSRIPTETLSRSCQDEQKTKKQFGIQKSKKKGGGGGIVFRDKIEFLFHIFFSSLLTAIACRLVMCCNYS